MAGKIQVLSFVSGLQRKGRGRAEKEEAVRR